MGDDVYIPNGYYFVDDLDGGRLAKKPEATMATEQRCVCGHVVHANIGGSGACRTHGCPCERFHDTPQPDKCECDGCWRESNMPPRTGGPLDIL